MKIVINTCFGGFDLSDAAYEKLIEYGVPVRAYIEQQRDPNTRLYLPEPRNEGDVIFDRDLTTYSDPKDAELAGAMRRLSGSRYWDDFTRSNRSHPLVVRVVEELGDAASGIHGKLKVVEIPDGVEWELDEYDGIEKVRECSRMWS